ncbi:MAG: hypothetical protein JWL70_1629 [Acidimicrobiia bacterium]|nr:hypothetical protein [Acidimicrobiia bacterium]
MTSTHIVPMEPEFFGVQVEEGGVTTSHRVRLTDGFVDDLQLGDFEADRIVEETISFLIERVPATSLPELVDIDALWRDYPDYYDELRARLAG